MQYDFRSVYGSLLMDWFGIEEYEARQLTMEEFTYLPLVDTCNDVTTTPVSGADIPPVSLRAHPNPTTGNIQLNINTRQETTAAHLYSNTGQRIRTLLTSPLPPGIHRISVDLTGLPAGPYFIQLVTQDGEAGTLRIVKH